MFKLLLPRILLAFMLCQISISALANVLCVEALQAPKVYTASKKLHAKNPELYEKYLTVFVETGFFLGPKLLEIFERQLINDGLLIYDVTAKSFVETKEQALHNQKTLTEMITATQSTSAILSGKIYEDLKQNLVLEIPHDSEKLSAEMIANASFSDRPWDSRTTTLEELLSVHEVLSKVINTEEGQALIIDLIHESIPVYAHMLNEFMVYSNPSVDLATVIAGRLGWSAVLTAAVGIVDPLTVVEAGAAIAGALVNVPGMRKSILYFRNRKVKKLQQQIGLNLAAELRRVVQ
jgi:hypothetical protein